MRVSPVQQAEVLLAIQRGLPDGFQVRHAGIGQPGRLSFNVWDMRTNCHLECELSPKDVARWTMPFDCDCGWAVDLTPEGVKEIPEHCAAIADTLRGVILRDTQVEGHA